jgi:hypothetical protein
VTTAAGRAAVPAAWLQQLLRLQLQLTELQAPTAAVASWLVLLLLLLLLYSAQALLQPHCCRYQLELLPQQPLPLLLQMVMPSENCCETPSCCQTPSCCLCAVVHTCQQQHQQKKRVQPLPQQVSPLAARAVDQPLPIPQLHQAQCVMLQLCWLPLPLQL